MVVQVCVSGTLHAKVEGLYVRKASTTQKDLVSNLNK